MKVRRNTQVPPAQLAFDTNNWQGSQHRPQTTRAGPATQHKTPPRETKAELTPY